MLIHLRRRRILLSVSVVAAACLAGAYLLAGHRAFRPKDATLGVVTNAADTEGTPVKVVRPRRDSTFRIAVQQLVTIEAFYSANLKARAAGLVKAVHKDIGDRVRQGDLLVEIDEPDLVIEVAQRDAVITQRAQEVAMARSHVRTAEAQVDVAAATVDQRRVEVQQHIVARETRLKRLTRFRAMNLRNVVDAGVIDEEEGFYRTEEVAVAAAETAVRRAEADLREKKASLEGARAEVELKEALVEVARRDRDRAQAMLDYARVVAPFDGTVTQRNVDPGAFVQNATTGSSESLVALARTDLVTAVFTLPDYAAAYMSRDTWVEMRLDELPGVVIRGQVTRYTPSIRGTDRTMRVEVDLFNGPGNEYRRFASRAVASAFAGAAGAGITALVPTAVGRTAWAQNQKGGADSLPLHPDSNTSGGGGHTFLPGMGGTVRVELQAFDDVFLLPSSAVFTLGGKTNVLEVRDGKSKLVPVKVQVNDGRLAKVVLVTRAADGRSGGRDQVKELTGDEMIIASRQLEIGDGLPVRATPEDW